MKTSGRGLQAYTLLYLLFLYAPIILLPLFAFNVGHGDRLSAAGLHRRLVRADVGQRDAAAGADELADHRGVGLDPGDLPGRLRRPRLDALSSFRASGGIMGFIMLPLVLPEIIVAMSLLVVLLGTGVQLSILTVIVGHTLICMPFAIAILSTAFSSLDRILEEAAYDLGETKWGAFRLVTLPLVMPGIISVAADLVHDQLDEFIIAFFLAGNEPTLPVYIFGQLRFPRAVPVIMALGTVLVDPVDRPSGARRIFPPPGHRPHRRLAHRRVPVSVEADDRMPDVHKYYGDYHALRGIDLTIRAGEFFSLLGPSGCGKTTLLRTIAGFEEHQQRRRADRRQATWARCRRTSGPTNMVFQSYAIFPHLTVAENVGFGLRRDPRSKADKAGGGRRGAGDGGPRGLRQRGRRMRCRAGSGSGWRWRGR